MNNLNSFTSLNGFNVEITANSLEAIPHWQLKNIHTDLQMELNQTQPVSGRISDAISEIANATNEAFRLIAAPASITLSLDEEEDEDDFLEDEDDQDEDDGIYYDDDDDMDDDEEDDFLEDEEEDDDFLEDEEVDEDDDMDDEEEDFSDGDDDYYDEEEDM